MNKNKLRKDDPVYYKVMLNDLFKQALNEGLTVQAQHLKNGVKIYFKASNGDISGVNLLENGNCKCEDVSSKPRCYGEMDWILKYPEDKTPNISICDCEFVNSCMRITRNKGKEE